MGGNRSKDTKKKGTKGRSKSLTREDRRGDILSSDKALHWVNVQILDHRCVFVCVCVSVCICGLLSRSRFKVYVTVFKSVHVWVHVFKHA